MGAGGKHAMAAVVQPLDDGTVEVAVVDNAISGQAQALKEATFQYAVTIFASAADKYSLQFEQPMAGLQQQWIYATQKIIGFCVVQSLFLACAYLVLGKALFEDGVQRGQLNLVHMPSLLSAFTAYLYDCPSTSADAVREAAEVIEAKRRPRTNPTYDELYAVALAIMPVPSVTEQYQTAARFSRIPTAAEQQSYSSDNLRLGFSQLLDKRAAELLTDLIKGQMTSPY